MPPLLMFPLLLQLVVVWLQHPTVLALSPALVPDTVINVHPANISNIDLSNRSLSGRLILALGSSEWSDWRQVNIKLLNLSGNPRLASVTIAGQGRVDAVHIECLDVSDTSMAPLPGRLVSLDTPGQPLASVGILLANGTAYAEPLDISRATELLYHMRVQSFVLVGWRLANNGRLPAANLTGHRDNSCASKRFHSLAVSQSRPAAVELTREPSSSTTPLIAVSDALDLSGNGLQTVAGVTISARRVDLSDNQLVDLPNVTFRPGSVCGAEVTGAPALLLRGNRLRLRVLNSLAGQHFYGLDLAENEPLLEETESQPPSSTPVYVSKFLDLSGLGAHAADLSSLLARFRLLGDAEEPDVPAGDEGSAFRLSLADNWLRDLDAASSVVDGFLANSDSNHTLHLDLSGNSLLVHLNLSQLSPARLASLTIERLPHLRSASVRIADNAAGAGLMERLRRRGQRPNGVDLARLWSQQVPLRLDARPSECCLSVDSELVCGFYSTVHDGSAGHHGRIGLAPRGSVFCYRSGEESTGGAHRHSWNAASELLPLFTGSVLGCALLLGLVTGIGIFYFRRRSQGRYAVYSIYTVYVKGQQQMHSQTTQSGCFATVGDANNNNSSNSIGRPVQLKAVQLPMEPAEVSQV